MRLGLIRNAWFGGLRRCDLNGLMITQSDIDKLRGDREKAIEQQDEAISIATELVMKPLLERVLAKREILKA